MFYSRRTGVALKATKDAIRRVREMTYDNAEDYLVRAQEAVNSSTVTAAGKASASSSTRNLTSRASVPTIGPKGRLTLRLDHPGGWRHSLPQIRLWSFAMTTLAPAAPPSFR